MLSFSAIFTLFNNYLYNIYIISQLFTQYLQYLYSCFNIQTKYNASLRIKGQQFHNTETSPLICRGNHLLGFYVMGPLTLNGLIVLNKFINNSETEVVHTSFFTPLSANPTKWSNTLKQIESVSHSNN